MIDIEPLEKTLALTLQSAYVSNNEKSISLLIVANAEHGKTQAMQNECRTLIKDRRVFFSNNLTQKFIETRLLYDIENGKIRHIVIPDLLNCIERAQATRKLFINFMKSLIEEGIVQVGDAYNSFNAKEGIPVKCGNITAITKANMRENFGEWRNIGFLSRMITFSYSYDLAKVSKILDSFLAEKMTQHNPKFCVNTRDSEIKDYENYAELKTIAMTEALKDGEIGTRYYQNLVYLCRSNANLENRDRVEKKDIDEILRLTKWFNLRYNPI